MNFLKKLIGNKKIILGIIFAVLFFVPNFSNARTLVGLSPTEQQLLSQRHPDLFAAPNYYAIPYTDLYPDTPNRDFFVTNEEFNGQLVLPVLREILTADQEFYVRLTRFDNEYGGDCGFPDCTEIDRALATVAAEDLERIRRNLETSITNGVSSGPLGIAMGGYNPDISRLRRLAGLNEENTPEGEGQLREDKRTADPLAITPGTDGGDDEIKCSFWDFDALNCAKVIIMGIGTGVIIPLFGSILAGASYLFDRAVFLSVTSFANTIGNLGSIQSTWAIIRDLANIFFIFILLYAAIGMTLRLDKIDAKKIIVRVIVIALLINFSAFFTRVVIDASNLLAYQFYRGIEASEEPYQIFGTSHTIKGAAGAIMSGLNMEKQFSGIKTDAQGNTTVVVKGGFFAIISSIFGTIFVIVVSTFVILAGTIMLIIRIVSLIFLIIISPLAFFAAAMPGQNNQFEKWFSNLTNQCFFAPAYLMFLFLSIKIINGINFSQSSTMDVWLQFFIIIGFLLASLIMATKMGAFGAQKAMGIAGKMNRSAFGTLTKLGKGGIRGVANLASKEGWKRNREGRARITGALKDWKNKVGESWDKDKKGEGGYVGAIAKAGIRTAKFTEKKVPLGKEVGEFLSKPLSTGSEHLSTLTAELPFGFKSGVLGPTRDEQAEQKKKEKEAKDAEKEEKLDAKKRRFSAYNPNDLTEKEAIEKELNQMKGDEITKMDEEAIIRLAHMFNNRLLDALQKDMDEDKFSKVMKAYTKPLTNALGEKPENDASDEVKQAYASNQTTRRVKVKEEMDKMETSVAPKLSNEILDNPDVIAGMSPEMIAKLRRSDRLTPNQFNKMTEQILSEPNHPSYKYIRKTASQVLDDDDNTGNNRGNNNQNAPINPTPNYAHPMFRNRNRNQPTPTTTPTPDESPINLNQPQPLNTTQTNEEPINDLPIT